MAPARPPEEPWREEARRQRKAFEREALAAGSSSGRDPGAGRTRRKKLAWLAGRVWAPDPDGLYLEVGTGAGTGMGFADLEPRHHVGLDPALPALAASCGSRRVAGLAEELPFLDATFDGVFGIDALHHLASPGLALAELRRVLKPGGRLAFVEPNPRFPASLLFLLFPLERGLYALRPARLEAWAATAGLAALEVGNLAVFFPSFPEALADLYQAAEERLGRVPGLRTLSTDRTIAAHRPLEAFRLPDPAPGRGARKPRT